MTSPPAGEKRSFLDVAASVLAAAQGPLSAEEITAQALARGISLTSGKTPSATMAARLYQDINRLGNQSRFVEVEAGRFGLSTASPRRSAGVSDASAAYSAVDAASVVPIVSSAVDQLVRELMTAQTDSKNPTRFEQAVRDAFDLLGFEATRLGGSGETDVYVVAQAGAEMYRVVVDAKSSGNARVTEGQINWVSVRDHRTHREAQHVLVVAPGFAGGNLLTRASEYQVALLQAEDLAQVVRWHVATPFSLIELRPLFEGPGHVTQALDDLRRLHEATTRQWSLLPEIVQAYVELGDVHPDVAGIYLYLRGRQGTRTLWQETVEHAISMLASPMLGVLRLHNGGVGYALTMRPETALLRLRAMTQVAAGAVEAKVNARAIPTTSPLLPVEATAVPSRAVDELEPPFEAVRVRVLARLKALGYQEVDRRSPHMVILDRHESRVVISFRSSKFYAAQRKWWWTFHDRVEGKARQEIGAVILVGLMGGETQGEATTDSVTWIEWDAGRTRVIDSVAWNKYRKMQVEMYKGGRGRWSECLVRIEELPDPLQGR